MLNNCQPYSAEGITLRFDSLRRDGTLEQAYFAHVYASFYSGEVQVTLARQPSVAEALLFVRTHYIGLRSISAWQEEVSGTAAELLFWNFRTVAIIENSDEASGYVAERCGAELVRLVAAVVTDDSVQVFQPEWKKDGGWCSAVRSIEYLFDGKGGRYLLVFAQDD